jgi:hypothetical protein
MKKKSTGLILLVLVIILGVAYIYREYNRKAANLADLRPDTVASSDSLLEVFSKDELEANKRYLGKVLQVSGGIRSIDTDKHGFMTIILGDDSQPSTVRCSMDSTSAQQALTQQPGTPITVKGICTGYAPDELGLGADLILNRCIVINK